MPAPLTCRLAPPVPCRPANPFREPWPLRGPSWHDAMRPAPEGGLSRDRARLGLPELQTWFCVPRSPSSTVASCDGFQQALAGAAAATPFRLAVFLGGFRTPALSRRTAMVDEGPASENFHTSRH
jgi:hypothetical protein